MQLHPFVPRQPLRVTVTDEARGRLGGEESRFDVLAMATRPLDGGAQIGEIAAAHYYLVLNGASSQPQWLSMHDVQRVESAEDS